MASATVQCYFNKIKLIKSLSNKSCTYNCANIITKCSANAIMQLHQREFSTNSDDRRLRIHTTLLPTLTPSYADRRQHYLHHDRLAYHQLHCDRPIKNSITAMICGTKPTSSPQEQQSSLQQQQQRKYCSSANNEFESRKPKRLPELMAFPKIVWPSIIKSMKNWILVNLIIRPYFDKEFNIPDFSSGTRHALQVMHCNMIFPFQFFFYGAPL